MPVESCRKPCRAPRSATPTERARYRSVTAPTAARFAASSTPVAPRRIRGSGPLSSEASAPEMSRAMPGDPYTSSSRRNTGVPSSGSDNATSSADGSAAPDAHHAVSRSVACAAWSPAMRGARGGGAGDGSFGAGPLHVDRTATSTAAIAVDGGDPRMGHIPYHRSLVDDPGCVLRGVLGSRRSMSSSRPPSPPTSSPRPPAQIGGGRLLPSPGPSG
jgi:hypothetical protein